MEAPALGDCRAAVNEYLKDQYDKKEAAAKDTRGGSLFASTRFQAVPADSDKPLTKLIEYRFMQNIITASDGGNKNVGGSCSDGSREEHDPQRWKSLASRPSRARF